MRMEYTNPPLGTATLLANLQNEGLAIMDERKAFAFLENVSYFRFAAYLRPFKASGKHDYKENATFEKAVRLYEFDAKLRTLLFSAIQKIEISLRAKVINQFIGYMKMLLPSFLASRLRICCMSLNSSISFFSLSMSPATFIICACSSFRCFST